MASAGADQQRLLAGAFGQASSSAGRERYQVARPNMSNAERLVQEALQVALVPGEVLSAYNPNQNRVLFPPRFGYPVDEMGIVEVLSVSSRHPGNQELVSRSPKSYMATSRPSGTDWY